MCMLPVLGPRYLSQIEVTTKHEHHSMWLFTLREQYTHLPHLYELGREKLHVEGNGARQYVGKI